MSFSAVPPSTNVLNGYTDSGEAPVTAQAHTDAVANAQAKAKAKGITKEAYVLGYLHGYSACFDVYDLSTDEHPPERKKSSNPKSALNISW